MSKKTVLLGVSGGVDSSFAISLLIKKYNVIGVFMRMGLNNEVDENHARRVCEFFGIKFYPIDVAEIFKKEIINYFISSYESGITPNPCVKCNSVIKFKILTEKARDFNCDFVATGHYAQIGKVGEDLCITKAVDKIKDQTYFLYKIDKKYLPKIIFPLGGYLKKDIQENILKNKVPCFKGESQDICFIPGDHNDFLKDNLELKRGDILNKKGEKVGIHNGLPLYTIGQRKGIEIDANGPYYVFKMDYKKNELLVSNDPVDKNLYTKKFKIAETNWLVDIFKDKKAIVCDCVVRYGGNFKKCTVEKVVDNKCKILLEEKQRAVTSGQSAVFYKNNILLGGGIIS